MKQLLLVLLVMSIPSVGQSQTFDMFGPSCKPKSRVTVLKPPIAIRSYSMVYNIEGDWSPSNQKIARHIQNTHGINPSGMSRAEMLMAHDRAHGVRVRSCPNGRCPR